ncbi:hypothetical protein D3C84_1134960 [compost metagenome]
MDQHGIDAGFADQQFLLEVAMAVAYPGTLYLVVVQIALHALGQETVVDQPGQVVGGKPGLLIQQHRAQLALVTDESGGHQDGGVRGRGGVKVGKVGHIHYLCV